MNDPKNEPELPVVAIVGRQNVGKSSLLNALARRRLAIVDPKPGVTRDRVSSLLSLQGRACEVVDTGGVGIDREEGLRADIERQIEHAIRHADVVLFIVDVKSGLMPLDEEIARRLRAQGGEPILVANKADHKGFDAKAAEFEKLGLGAPLAIAAVHRRNVDAVVGRIAERLPEGVSLPEEGLKIAVVGRRNVGKSTYVNALCGEERVIVSETPGTTRDAVDVRIVREGKSYVLIDTAGLRKKKRVADSVEFFSHDRTEKAIRRADAVLLMFDATQKVSKVDKKVGGLLEEVKVPSIVLLNKWDLVPEDFGPEQFVEYLSKAMPVLAYSPVTVISAERKERIWDPVEVAEELHVQAGTRVPTPVVNRALQHAQSVRAPGSRGGKAPKIFYGTQARVRPPTFFVFVNDPRAFAPDYVRYLENKFREYLPFPEVPIKLTLRRRRGEQPSARSSRRR
ncbi:MAG: ribosome biogenesis GTPase Der [Planctomycetota bacterium]